MNGYGYPPPPPQPPRRGRNDGDVLRAGFGVGLLLVRWVVPEVWHSGGVSLAYASSACRSGLIQLLASQDCSKIGEIMTALNLVAFAGVGLLVWAGVSLLRRRA